MRRSAAPSQLYAKRPRFNPPIIQKKQSDDSAASTTPQVTRSKEDVLRLVGSGSLSAGSNLDSGDVVKASPENERQFKQQGDHEPVRVRNEFPKSPVEDCYLTPIENDNDSSGVPRSNQENVSDGGGEKEERVDSETSLPVCQTADPPKPSFLSRPRAAGRGFRPPTAARPFTPHNQIATPKNATVTRQNESDDEPKSYFYNIVWCKLSKKKHKKWEGDAIIKAKGRSVTIFDTEGKEIGRGSGYKVNELATMSEGQTLVVGGKEIEIMSILNEEDFESGRCFQTAAMVSTKPSEVSRPKPAAPTKPFVRPQLKGSESPVQVAVPVNIRPKFDPSAPDALVMPRPSPSLQRENPGQQVVDVVVDPHLSYHLRPHQRAGITFLYQCVMGMNNYNGLGAILADEMGLGKTLQCIALIWTLYKQGPYNGKPVLRRVLIITPGSLVKNWVREFKKWLGNERMKVYAVNSEQKAETFAHSTVYPAMIISYEMFIRNFDAIQKVKFDLVVCDEGHRLKNTNIKTTSFMMNLSTRRRIVLTGTPVQNDMKELYSIVEFCNPGVLGTSSAFHHVYEAPILASRQPTASQKEITLGETRAQELNRVTAMFILRRTQDLNNKYLPPKVEIVLFCQPTRLQISLYQRLLSSKQLRYSLSGGVGGDGAQHLMSIAAMKKLCNCPSLLHKGAAQAEDARLRGAENEESELYSRMLELYPSDYSPAELNTEHCGKLLVLATILAAAHDTTPRQKVVLVSNYTQTLDVLELMCRDHQYSFLRLDGQTPTSKRQQLVERFNNKHTTDFIFLLSSKAGGVGLNLIGASRLILYDIDWNPANDLQAMARIWRDGQRNTVYIYRLITTGTIEEKMYQRQVSKQGLSGVVVDAKANSQLHFSPEELKDLFRPPGDSLCATHDLLDCDCDIDGEPDERRTSSADRPTQNKSDKNVCMDELMDWKHIRGPAPALDHVDPLFTSGGLETITYAFWNVSGGQPVESDAD